MPKRIADIHRTRIKICGVTRPRDAEDAARAGADAVGMVFHPPSKRNVGLEAAAEIVSAIPPPVIPIALFVSAYLKVILDVTDQLGINQIQFSGDEPPGLLRILDELFVIKSFAKTGASLTRMLNRWRRSALRLDLCNWSGVVFDTPRTGKPGGSGMANDWASLKKSQERGVFDDLPPIFLAGGLTPETVGGVVELLQPYAVDVSSGVESAPGKKSFDKMRAFVDAVRAADARIAANEVDDDDGKS